jgi:hypothetical protein
MHMISGDGNVAGHLVSGVSFIQTYEDGRGYDSGGEGLMYKTAYTGYTKVVQSIDQGSTRQSDGSNPVFAMGRYYADQFFLSAAELTTLCFRHLVGRSASHRRILCCIVLAILFQLLSWHWPDDNGQGTSLYLVEAVEKCC